MPPDLIVYALIAAGLIFWLRSILGTRHGDERERPNPYIAPQENTSEQAAQQSFTAEDALASPADMIAEMTENSGEIMSVENKTAETGLLNILEKDASFDIGFFLQGAQDAFVIIVESFAEGDRETLRGLLDDSVYNAFDGAIAEREKSGEILETEIHAIRKVEVLEADVKNKTAFITVRFTADETSVTKDAEGQILSGHPENVTEMRDIWVFGRPIRSRDPRWLVYETRGDFEGDNETIPNSDE